MRFLFAPSVARDPFWQWTFLLTGRSGAAPGCPRHGGLDNILPTANGRRPTMAIMRSFQRSYWA